MNFLLNNRTLVIINTIVLTVIVAFGMIGLEIDSSITSVLPEDNPDFLYNQKISEIFTSSEEIIISVITDPDLEKNSNKANSNVSLTNLDLSNENEFSVYSISNIEMINKFTKFVLSLEQVDKEGVNSIITIAKQFSIEGDTNEEKKLFFEGEITSKEVKWVKKMIEQNPMTRGRIINNQHTNTVITVPIPNDLSYEDTALNLFIDNLTVNLDEIVADYPNSRYELTGQPKVKADITKYIMQDVSVLLPIAILFVMIIIFLLTKSIRGTIIPLIVTILSVVWTFGFKGLLGMAGLSLGAITLTESVLPVVLISVACADGIHITNQSLYFIDRGVPGKAAVYDAMQLVRLPVILAAITTAVGFGSLIFSPGRSLKNMGIFLAFGVVMAMIFSLILIPVLISFFKTQRFSQRRSHRATTERFAFTKYMRPITSWLIKKRWFVLAATIVLIAVSIPATLNIKTDQDEVRFFVKNAPVRVATENIEKNLGGISTMYLVMESESDIPLLPRNLYKDSEKMFTREETTLFKESVTQIRAMELIQKRSELEPAVSYTTSYSSYLQLMNYYNHPKNLSIKNFRIPNNWIYFARRLIPNFEQQNMVGDAVTKKFITDNGDMINTHIRIKDSNTSSMKKVVDNMNIFLCKLYQIDEKKVPSILSLQAREKSVQLNNKNRLISLMKKDNNIAKIQKLRNGAKTLGYKNVENWYHSKNSVSDIYKLDDLSFKNWFRTINNLQEKKGLILDRDYRLIADQFKIRDLTILSSNPVKFRWAGDHIRIVNGSIIVQSQIISLSVATIIILILLSFIFKSPLTGLLLSTPVIIAIFLNFTIMWLFRISLNPATSIVASVGMGVGIDYAIHYYSRFRKLFQISGDYNKSLIDASVHSSSGIIMNAIAVGAGFLILWGSKYTIIKHMGMIVAFSMLTSGVGALTILPTLLYIFKPKVSTKSRF